jgi:ComF family protein
MIKDLINMIYPQICPTCSEVLDTAHVPICLQCQYLLPLNHSHLHADNDIASRFWGRLPLTHAFSFLHFVHGGKTQALLHELKYKGNQAIGVFLGRLFAQTLKEANMQQAFELIVPIPLHPSKLQKRGYNQVDCIAQGMAAELAIAWEADALVRVRANVSQTTQDRIGRLENSAQLFEVNPKLTIKGKKVLLLDDVITTGATIESAALELLAAQCQALSVAALASGV